MSNTIFVDYNGGASFSLDPSERWNKALRQLSVLARGAELDPATVQVVATAGNRLTVEFPGVKVLRSEFLVQAESLLNQEGFIDEFNTMLGNGTRLFLPADRNSEPTVR